MTTSNILSLDMKTFGDSVLKEKSLDIEVIDEQVIGLLRQIGRKMKDLGYGSISAIQMGYPLRCIVVESTDSTIFMINPTVIEQSSEVITLSEVCSSMIGVSCNITRPRRVTVEFFNMDKDKVRMQLNDEMSRSFLHEMDHLEGRNFIDRCESEEEREELVKNYYKSLTI